MEQKQESLRTLLNKIAKEHKYENHEIIINEIFSGGANFSSTLFTVIIREENKEDLYLFAKIAAFGEDMRKEMPIDFYDTERFAYTKLAKMYASLEEENGVPEEHRLFFTKCFGFDASRNQDILVLENLLAVGYGTHDRFTSFDWEYASTAVTDLAKMHALSFALSQSNTGEFEKTLEVLKPNWLESENMENMVKNMARLAFDNVNPEYKDALEKFVENMPPPFQMTFAIRKTVIIHGDFRGNNLLHRVREDGKLEIKILDLQTLQGGSPACDLLYFIFTGSDEEFRAKYYEKLLDHYYMQLSAAMKRLNLDPEETFSREDFDYEMKEKMAYGLLVAVFLLPIVTVDSENAPEINESAGASAFTVDKAGDLYPERLNGDAVRSEIPLEIYDTERFAYTKLAKIYESLEEENGVPEEHRLFFTKCYGFDASRNQEILVLENLLAVGYGPHDRFQSYDWEYASSAVTDLAKMHALSFAFSKKSPEEFEKTLTALKMDWKESENLTDMLKKMVNVALDNIKPEYRDALDKFMEDKSHPFTMTGAIGRPAIIHGDFRGNNLCHRVREDGKVDIKVLDLQTLVGGSPAADLLYFIFTGSDEEFRAKYYEKLLDHYYTQLSAAMKRLNLDPKETFSREDFDYKIKEKMPYGLTLAVFILPVVTIDSENAPEVNESMDFSNLVFEKTSNRYAERLNGVINDFVKWGILT